MVGDRIPLGQWIGAILQDDAIKREILRELALGSSSAGRFGFSREYVNDARARIENFDSTRPINEFGDLEAIVQKIGRPVLFVQKDKFAFPTGPRDLQSDVWKDRLEKAASRLEPRIPVIGRINLKYHESLDWVGTGWLVRPNIVVSNAHVAAEFAVRNSNGEGYDFKQNFLNRRISASIDFKMEYGNDEEREIRIEEVIYIGKMTADGYYNPDVALFRLKENSKVILGEPIPLSLDLPEPGTEVAVIGYPALDSRFSDSALMRRVFGDTYSYKRLAPGKVLSRDEGAHIVTHDASTLGGNSGSVVLDLATGRAVGLHFAGSFLHANYAVATSVIQKLVKEYVH